MTEWKERFKFVVEYNGALIEGVTRIFDCPYYDLNQLENSPIKGEPSKLENCFQNSWESVHLAEQISSLLRSVLKRSSVDFLWKNHNRNLTMTSGSVNNYESNNKYTFKIIDTQAFKYGNDGKPLYEEGTVERELMSVDISADDFIPFNPNYKPEWWKVWKDFSSLNDDGDEIRLVNTQHYTKGIRTLIKESFNKKKYVNRRLVSRPVDNLFYVS